MALSHQPAARHRRTGGRRDRAHAGHLGVRPTAVALLLIGAGVLSGAAVMSVDQWRDRVLQAGGGMVGSAPATRVARGAVGETASSSAPAGRPSRSGPAQSGAAAVAGLDPGHLRLLGSATRTAVGGPARGPVVRAAGVLRAWDRRRARAWAEGDVRALRTLYVDRAGVADVRLLRRYADRGYRVEGLTTQLLAVDVLEQRRGRWLLRVTDRLAGAVAVRGAERVPLPRDGVDTHVVALVRGAEGRWRVAEVRAG